MLISNFKGEIPRLSSKLLPDNFSTECVNCVTESGRLEAGPAPELFLSTSGSCNSIFPAGGNKWYVWTTAVDAVKAFDDTTGHIYYTDGTRPKETWQSIGLPSGNGQAPATAYRLGVPRDEQLSQITKYDTGSSTGLGDREYSYCHVCVTATGKVSRPSEPTANISFTDDEYPRFDLDDFDIPSGAVTDGNIDGFYLYRLAVGTDGAEYQMVPYNSSTWKFPTGATGNWDDDNDDDALGETLPTGAEYWFEPEDDLEGLVRFRETILAGFVGKTVYLSEPDRVYAWPYSYTFHDNIIGLAVDQGTLIVLTDGTTGFLTGFDPAAMSQTYVNFIQPCQNKDSIVSTPYGVLYASPAGITEARSGRLLTRHLWRKEDWSDETPASMIATFYDEKYYDFIGNSGFWLELNNIDSVYRMSYTGNVLCALAEGDTVYLGMSDGIYSLTDTAATFSWKTKEFLARKKSNFTHAQVIADGSITFFLYRDGTGVDSNGVTDDTIFRLEKSYQASYLSARVYSAGSVIDSISLGRSPDEVAYG